MFCLVYMDHWDYIDHWGDTWVFPKGKLNRWQTVGVVCDWEGVGLALSGNVGIYNDWMIQCDYKCYFKKKYLIRPTFYRQLIAILEHFQLHF